MAFRDQDPEDPAGSHCRLGTGDPSFCLVYMQPCAILAWKVMPQFLKTLWSFPCRPRFHPRAMLLASPPPKTGRGSRAHLRFWSSAPVTRLLTTRDSPVTLYRPGKSGRSFDISAFLFFLHQSPRVKRRNLETDLSTDINCVSSSGDRSRCI